MKRIDKLEKSLFGLPPWGEGAIFMKKDITEVFKAFRVMRAMCIKYADQSWHRGDPKEINKEFEKHMAKETK